MTLEPRPPKAAALRTSATSSVVHLDTASVRGFVTVSARPFLTLLLKESPMFRHLAFVSLLVLPVSAFGQSDLAVRVAFTIPARELLQQVDSYQVRAGTEVKVILDEKDFLVAQDGRVRRRTHFIYQVLSADAVSSWAEVSATYEPWYQRRPELRARVVSPDGEERYLDPKLISESGEREVDETVFTDTRQLRAPLPHVVIGCVIEIETVVDESRAFFAGGLSTAVHIGRGVPLQRGVVRIEVPEPVPLRYEVRLLPGAHVEKQAGSGVQRLTVTAGPLDALDLAEPYLPFEEPRYPEVLFSTGESWGSVAQAYLRLLEKSMRPEDVDALARQAVAGTTVRHEQIARLVALLHKRVRYTGVEFGQAGLLPARPAEILRRGYGDCKDKALLLVSLLRCVGIDAHLALLLSGTGADVLDSLPGMGRFNHAVVYLPGGEPSWIDATVLLHPLTALPYEDQGRKALVIKPDTSALTTIALTPAESNRSVETREFTLSSLGRSRVLERTESIGQWDRQARADFDNADEKHRREGLERYMRTTYFAERLERVTTSDGRDLAAPFVMTLEATDAKAGITELEDAAVIVDPRPIFNALPAILRPPESGEKDKGTVAKRRSSFFVLPYPFVVEWRFKIHPPAGFLLSGTPVRQDVRMGPVLLTVDFPPKQADAIVQGLVRLESGPRVWSASDVEAFQTAWRTYTAAPAQLVRFEHTGLALMNAGRHREAIAELRRLADANPKDAVQQMRLSQAYLTGGLGEAARLAAARAVALGSNARAQANLGEVLRHDVVGREFRRGWDRDGAIAAYTEAARLDPNEPEYRTTLGVVFEHDAGGVRYADRASTEKAIEQYLHAKPDLPRLKMTENLLAAYFRAERFEDLEDYARSLPSDHPSARAYQVLASAVLRGPSSGAEEARRLGVDDVEQRKLLITAADSLVRLRRYEVAAGLVKLAARGAAKAGELDTRAGVLGGLKRIEETPTVNDPTGLARRYAAVLFGSPDAIEPTLAAILSRHNLQPDILRGEIEQAKKIATTIPRMVGRGDFPAGALSDLLMSMSRFSYEGDDRRGYRVQMIVPGSTAMTLFIVRENGQYKVLGDADDAAIGKEVLARVATGDLLNAKGLLDWLREVVEPAGGDDPLVGPLLPRFWSKSKPPDVDQLRYAAATQLTGKATAGVAVPILEEGLARASISDRPAFLLALDAAYTSQKAYQQRLQAARALYSLAPGSDVAGRVLFYALVDAGQPKEALELAMKLRAEKPADDECLRLIVRALSALGQWKQSAREYQVLFDAQKATAADYNSLAWAALFRGDLVTEGDIGLAQKAVTDTQRLDANSLHTLAALYAEVGKIAEARETLHAAMDVWALEQPNSACWYVVGRIAEQFGEVESARRAYSRMNPEEDDGRSAVSTRRLAAKRLSALPPAARK